MNGLQRSVDGIDFDLSRDYVANNTHPAVRWTDTGRRVTFLARYDSQSRDSIAPPPESTLSSGVFTINRFTYGLNFTLAGGSLFMINHERWTLPDGLGHTGVVGVRWACSFKLHRRGMGTVAWSSGSVNVVFDGLRINERARKAALRCELSST